MANGTERTPEYIIARHSDGTVEREDPYKRLRQVGPAQLQREIDLSEFPLPDAVDVGGAPEPAAPAKVVSPVVEQKPSQP